MEKKLKILNDFPEPFCYSMSIKIDNKTAKLTQHKTINQYDDDGVEIGILEISTYNIDDILKNTPIEQLISHHNLLWVLYPYFIQHILKPQYRNRNFTFVFSY